MSETLETCPEPSSGRVVFLHGSGTGPWIWDAARRHLAVASTALTVPSNRSGTDPVLCASEILSDPAFPAHGPVVLALHSLAGVLETPLAMTGCGMWSMSLRWFPRRGAPSRPRWASPRA